MNKAPWTIVAILFAASVFGQEVAANPKSCKTPCPKADCAPKCCPTPCPQPCPPTQLCPPPCPSPCCPPWPVPVLNAAYNYPAQTQTRCGWDVFTDASFIYWQPSAENLEVGVADTTDGTTGSPDSSAPMIGSVINMKFGFKPGFQVGIGMNAGYDGWDAYAQYTYLRSTNHTNATASTPGRIRSFWVNPAILLTEDGPPDILTASAEWKANFDFVDAVLGRAYYSGTKVTYHPYFGLRGAFIRQRYTNNFVLDNDFTAVTVDKSRSWGVGPRFGVDGDWHIGSGFRIYGDGAADILYTQYDIGSKQTSMTAPRTNLINVSQDNIGYLRTHLDLELGLGWSMFADCNKWFFDFTAGYGFQAFFGQGMFRRWLDDVNTASSTAPLGDLFIQGMTLKARMDF